MWLGLCRYALCMQRALTLYHSHAVKAFTQEPLPVIVMAACCGHTRVVFWASVPVLEVLSCWCSSEACSAAKGTAAAETKGAAAAKAQGAGTKTSTAASGEPTKFLCCLAMQSVQTLCSPVVFEVVLPAGNLPTWQKDVLICWHIVFTCLMPMHSHLMKGAE